MPDPDHHTGSGSPAAPEPRRLNSWKEVAAYLGTSVRTAHRWEDSEALPVRRHGHANNATVYAYTDQLEAWLQSRAARKDGEPVRAVDSETPARDGSPISRRVPGWLWASGALVAAGCALYVAAVGFTPGKGPGLRTRSFSAALPSQMYPAWSPDGKSIAYIGTLAGRLRLMVQPLNAYRGTALTGDELELLPRQSPFWGPDSKTLFFFGRNGSTPGVYQVPAAGGTSVLVQRSATAASISPDGRTLVFLAAAEGGKFRIYSATPPSGERRAYAPELFASPDHFNHPTVRFAPDGRKVIVAVNLPEIGPQYWILPWPGGTPHKVFEELPFGRLPSFSWMTNSRHLVFLVSRPRPELFMADTESGHYWPVVNLDRAPMFPSVSPEGSRLAYQSSLSHTDVVAVPLDNSAAGTVFGTSDSEEMAACSRSGELAYVTDRRGAWELWLSRLDGGADRPLFSTPEGNPFRPTASAAPVLSPDGRFVAYRAPVPRKLSGLLVADARGNVPPRIVLKSPVLFAPQWSPDGSRLVFVELVGEGYRVRTLRLDGKEPPVDLAETNRQGLLILPEWSPAGDWIAFGDRENRLTLISPDGGRLRHLGGSGPVSWSRDGKTLYQVTYDSATLVGIDVATGSRRHLRDLGELKPYATTNPANRLSLTPDGRKVIFSVLRAREEIRIFEGLSAPKPPFAGFWLSGRSAGGRGPASAALRP